MRTLLPILAISLAVGCASGSTPPPTQPAAVGEEPPATGRSAEDCAAIVDHIQSVVVEAVDRPGMMAACQDEWSDQLAGCLGAATNDDEVSACW